MYRKIQQIPCSDPNGSTNLRRFQPASQLISPSNVLHCDFTVHIDHPHRLMNENGFPAQVVVIELDCIVLLSEQSSMYEKLDIVTFNFCTDSCLHLQCKQEKVL